VALLLAACNDSIPVPEDNTPARRTVIVYMMAENSLNRFAQSDISEMLRAADQIPEDCNLVVYLDNTLTPVIFTISAAQGQSTWKTLPEEVSTDSAVFQRNIQEIVKHYPAENYSLVLWSHGTGWLPQPNRAIGVDNNLNSSTLNSGSELEIPALRGALEQVGVHWDYIFFDACFMQCVEIDYELRNLADYIIASPAELPAGGAPYVDIMSSMMADENAAEGIVENYFNVYAKNKGLVISAVKCDEMGNLLTATRRAVPDFYTLGYNLDTYGIQPYCIFIQQSYWKPEYYDMGSVMNAMLDPDAYNTWQEQMQKTICQNRFTTYWTSDFSSFGFNARIIDSNHCTTLSIFVPNEKYTDLGYNEDIKQYAWYKEY